MKPGSRFLLPLAAALLLGAALVLRFFMSAPEPEASPVAPVSPVTVAPEPVSPAATPTKPEPVKAQEAPVGRVEVVEQGRATVVPIQPGDLVPEPEVENPPPQRNEPIEPEKPQTAEWKHGKTVRISELLERDVERLEEERLAAEKRGDGEEAKRLEVRLKRHRVTLGKLRQETETLAETARQESRQ
jgi:hypothetical protein